MKPTWESEGVQLYLGDCLQIMPELAGVDAVVTDPPYGIGYQSAWRTDSERFAHIAGDASVSLGWVAVSRRCVGQRGCVFVFCRWDVAEAFRVALAAEWDLRSQVIWDRGIHGLGDLRAQYGPRHDTCWFATAGDWEFPGKRPTSVYAIDRLAATDLVHPAQKPSGLMARIVLDLTCSGDTVLDPFMGSGTTGVACVQTGRKFIGVEIDPGYFEIAKKRISEAQLQIRMPFPEASAE